MLSLHYAPEPTGNAPYAAALARGLQRSGALTVQVITSHPHYPEWRIAPGYGQWRRDEVLDGVDVRRLLHYVPRPPKGVKRLLSEVSIGIRQVFTGWRRPDVVLLLSPALFASAVVNLRARLARIPRVVWVQDLYSIGLEETGQGGALASRVARATEGWLLRSADRVVVIHQRFADLVHQRFGVSRNRITVVRNWTHLPKQADIDRREARAALGWPLDSRLVLHAGNMGLKQGLQNVIEAARLADEQGSNVQFVLLGNGSERDSLRQVANGIERVRFVDPLDDERFTLALAAADVLLVNELEGVAEMAVPSKLTSYFSAGRPVLAATDPAGITASELRAAAAGVVVQAGDPSALLEAALDLLDDVDSAAELGSNGRRFRDTVLDENHAINSWTAILRDAGQRDRR